MNLRDETPNNVMGSLRPTRVGTGISIRALVSLGSAFVVFPLAALGVYFASHHNAPTTPGDLYVSIENSVLASVAALVLVSLFGIPLGYFLFVTRSSFSRVLAVILRLPLGVPPLVAGVMLLVAFGPNSPLGHLFGGRLTNTFLAIVIAQSFASLPYVVEGARGAFGSVDPRAQVVAASLKMTPVAEMVAIYIPLAWTSIRSALTLGYLRAFGEFGAVLLVAYSPLSLPIYTYVSFEGSGLAATAIPIAVTLLISGAFALGLSGIPWPTSPWLNLIRSRARENRSLARAPLGAGGDGASRIRVYAALDEFLLDIDFVAKRGCTVMLGPSGAGKTLTLNALCNYLIGHERIEVDGPIGEIRKEALGYVPQRFGLWPHMTLSDNLTLASSVSRSGRDVNALLAQLDLMEFADRLPSSLSGGQYQRGALARAMATNSPMVILDEPLSALDAQLRATHQRLIDTVVKSTVDYLFVVTHDVAEAAYLADWLVVIQDGKVLQQGSVDEVLTNPNNVAVARIIGADNVVRFSDNGGIVGHFVGKVGCFFSQDVMVLSTGTPRKFPAGIAEISTGKLLSAKQTPWSGELRFDLGTQTVLARPQEGVSAEYAIGSTYRLGVPEARLFLFD